MSVPTRQLADSPSAPALLSASQLRRAAWIARLGAPVIGVLGRTYRWRVEGTEHFDGIVASGRQPIFAFWHGRILAATLFWRDRGIVVMTSENFDGEWIAGIIRRFGYRTARGSSSRGGVRALVQMKRDMAAGRPAAFTVDGPRGPALIAQPGAVWLAGASGSPLLPFHLEASRYWTAGSWDRTQVPHPFSTVAIAIRPPITVPGTDRPALEEGVRMLQSSLGEAERAARALLWSAVPPKKTSRRQN